jgi:putative addiction module component (TIGR02574 family)
MVNEFRIYSYEVLKMSDALDQITLELLSLPATSRAHIAQKLIESLDEGEDENADALWAEEAERRCKEVDEGKVQMLDWDEVLEEIRRKIRE